MKEVFTARLTELAARDPRVMLLTADLGFGAFDSFARDYPRQFLNVGVAEQNLIGVGTGLALEGRTVFVYSIANFPTLRCLEQIRNDACYHNANVKVVAVGAGFSYGALGISHHATEDVSILRSLPAMTVFSPGDDWEAAECTTAAAAQPGTCYMRIDRSSGGNLVRPGEKFTIGRARLLREGDDATIAVTGGLLGTAIETAEQLSKASIECRVLSFPTIKPLDVVALAEAAQETGGLFTLEEHTVDGGLGGAVAENLLELGAIPRVFQRIGLRDGFSSIVGSQTYLRQRYGLDTKSVAACIVQRLTSKIVKTFGWKAA